MSPEERAAELADQVQALAFTAWARQDAEHREAAEKLGRKVVRLLREAENQGIERAALKLAEWKEASARQGMPAARQRWENAETAIRALKLPERHFAPRASVSDGNPPGEDAAAAEGQSPASAAALAETPSSSPQV